MKYTIETKLYVKNNKDIVDLNGFMEIFESVSFLKEIGYGDVDTRIDKCFSDENKYPELQ